MVFALQGNVSGSGRLSNKVHWRKRKKKLAKKMLLVNIISWKNTSEKTPTENCIQFF